MLYRTVSVNAFMAVMHMMNYTEQQGIDVKLLTFGHALIHKARNDTLSKLRPDADYILFVDDDMLPEPDSLVRLLKHELPVVSALCTTRAEPVKLACRIFDEESNQYRPLTQVNLGGVVSGKLVAGAAFLLVSREALDRVIEYYLSGKDWIDSNNRLLNLLHVRSPQREDYRQRLEKVLRARWEQEGYIAALWEFPVGTDGLVLGEDVAFCAKLHRLGIDVAIDGQTIVGHIGEYAFSVYDILRREKEEREALRPVVEQPIAQPAATGRGKPLKVWGKRKTA